MAATLKPVLTISGMQAQAIIDRVAPGRKLSRIGELLMGEISAVFEMELEGGPPSLVLKVYPEALHWKLQKGVTVARLLDGKLGVPTPAHPAGRRQQGAECSRSSSGSWQALPSSRDDRNSHGSSGHMWSAALLCSTAVPGRVFATSTSTQATCSRRDATDRSV